MPMSHVCMGRGGCETCATATCANMPRAHQCGARAHGCMCVCEPQAQLYLYKCVHTTVCSTMAFPTQEHVYSDVHMHMHTHTHISQRLRTTSARPTTVLDTKRCLGNLHICTQGTVSHTWYYGRCTHVDFAQYYSHMVHT